MATTTPAQIETFLLGDRPVPRVWVGLWQLSSPAWGTAPAARIRREMARHVDRGYTAFDMADHYGSSEQLFGQYRSSLTPQQANSILGATKWCVFRPTVPTRAVVEAAVRERMSRMRTERVDFLQFHWQDYNDKAYLTALKHLGDLRAEGVISGIGLVNFDAVRTDEICTEMAGYRSRDGQNVVMTNQIQFSLIDTRPLHGMSDVCQRHGIKLLTYGTLCGGFLADKWLGQPEPDAYKEHMTPSQRKYLDVILTAWGGWALFQQLLSVLKTIGNKHGASIANVATRWVLDHDCVGAVIIGARLGVSEHLDDNQKVFGWTLSEEDKAAVEAILDRSNGRRMITTIGDCGAEYRGSKNVYDMEEKLKGDGRSRQVTATVAGNGRIEGKEEQEEREQVARPDERKVAQEGRQGPGQPVGLDGLKKARRDREQIVVGQEGTESDTTTAVGGDSKDDANSFAKRRLSSYSVTLALILGFGAILVMLTWEADMAKTLLR